MPEIDIAYKTALSIAHQNSLGQDLVYCMEEQRFYIYEDGCWIIKANIELMDLIMRKHGDTLCYYTFGKRMGILDNLTTIIYKKLDTFNKTGFLNFPEGEMDMDTGYIHNHDKDNYSTFRMPYHFKFGAECPLWVKTLGEIFEDDRKKIDVLQEFFGYCLTRDVRKEKALLLLGESRTGKSTILETLSAVLGADNCASVPLTEIYNAQYTQLLMNKLVCIDTDVSGKADSYEAQFKTITSGEPIACNPKYVAPFTFRPYCKLIMAANEFPRITDHSSAFYKRLILLPCDRVFDDNEQNISLKDDLQKELCGIFNWAWEGLKRLQARGRFENNDFMKEAIEDLRLESNPVEMFFEEQIEGYVDDNIFIEKGELYERYKAWAHNGQHYVLNSARFSQSVQRKFNKFTPKNTRFGGKRIWKNLRYKDTTFVKPQDDIQWQE